LDAYIKARTLTAYAQTIGYAIGLYML